jgi:hypothetical protein
MMWQLELRTASRPIVGQQFEARPACPFEHGGGRPTRHGPLGEGQGHIRRGCDLFHPERASVLLEGFASPRHCPGFVRRGNLDSGFQTAGCCPSSRSLSCNRVNSGEVAGRSMQSSCAFPGHAPGGPLFDDGPHRCPMLHRVGLRILCLWARLLAPAGAGRRPEYPSLCISQPLLQG